MKRSLFLTIIILVSLVLASCGSSNPESTPDEANPYAVFTQAAQTAEARSGEIANSTTTPSAPIPSAAPTEAATTQATESTTGETAATQPSDKSGDAAEFVRDVSIPDGTEVPPNGNFTKTWRLKNTGSTTWTTDYKVVFIGGDRMGAPEAVPLVQTVAPNQDIDIAVDLIAPDIPGTYTGYFNLQNKNGEKFGVGVGSIEAFWVEVTVSEDAIPLATNTPSTPAEAVTQVFLYTDVINVNICPHTYIFNAIITLSEAAPVTYRLEAEIETPGVVVILPEPVTVNLDAGSHTFEFPLTFTSDVKGFVQLHVTFPGDHYSNPVNFTLSCP